MIRRRHEHPLPSRAASLAAPGRPLRVLHVIDNLSLGGTQQLLLKAVRALDERGIQSQVCVLGDASRTYPWDKLPADPIYLDLRCDYRRPWQVWRCARRVRETIDRVNPDLVHSYLWLSDVLTALANRKGRRPHVSQIVDRREWQASDRLRHRVRRGMTRWIFRNSPMRFLAVSDAARQYAIDTLGLEPDSIRVAYNSVDPSQFDDLPPSAFVQGARPELVLGTASRLELEKGHVVLFEALAHLQRRGRWFRLIVTGEGPCKEQLVEHCRRLNIASQVQFVGWVANIRDLLAEIDVFVVPSIHSEGLPTTILEAMAAGRAVVATDVGGAAEAIRDHRDGMIVPPHDADRLARVLLHLQEFRGLTAGLAQAARERVRSEFSVDQMADAIVEQYGVCLSGTGGTPVV